MRHSYVLLTLAKKTHICTINEKVAFGIPEWAVNSIFCIYRVRYWISLMVTEQNKVLTFSFRAGTPSDIVTCLEDVVRGKDRCVAVLRRYRVCCLASVKTCKFANTGTQVVLLQVLTPDAAHRSAAVVVVTHQQTPVRLRLWMRLQLLRGFLLQQQQQHLTSYYQHRCYSCRRVTICE